MPARCLCLLLCLALPACSDSTGPDEMRDNIVEITSGNGFSCALDGAGLAYCWGDNTSGQLGRDTVSDHGAFEPVAGGLRFEALDAGDDNVCGLSDRRAYCWGDDERSAGSVPVYAPEPVPSDGVEFVAISVGGRHACALADDGSAWCWGANDIIGGGQLGDGTTTSSARPVPVAGGHRFDELSAGFVHTCGRTGAEVWCWGSNFGSALGVEGVEYATTPVRVPIAVAARRIRTGAAVSCVETDTTVHCWGYNVAGQLGDGSTVTERPGAIAIASAARLTHVDMADVNSVVTHLCGIDDGGRVHCWGVNDAGQLGRNVSDTCPVGGRLDPCDRVPAPIESTIRFERVAPGADHTCGISDGDIYCWGAGDRGQLGGGPRGATPTPVKVETDPETR